MNNRSYIFWIAVIIGVLLGIIIYYKYVPVKEQFAVVSEEKTVKIDTPECPSGIYDEELSKIPYNKLMRVYLSSFSDKTVDESRNPYCANLMRWFDMKNPEIYFNINSSSPQSSIIGKGMRTKNVQLIGPSSEYFASDNISYELNPFTIFFYASLEVPVFEDDNQEISIFRLYAETPNNVQLIMKKSPKNNSTRVQLILGNFRNRYTWDIITSTLISNKMPSLYALTFDTNLKSDNKTAIFYIGKTEYSATIVNFDQSIKLSNSRMEINSSGLLDATLYSFGFIDKKLTSTEIGELGEYMYGEHTGKSRDMAIKYKKLENSYEKDLNSKLSDMEKKLEKKCALQEKETVEAPKKKEWSISVPEADKAIATDTDVCSVLKIQKSSPAPAPAPAPIPASSSTNNYHISYP